MEETKSTRSSSEQEAAILLLSAELWSAHEELKDLRNLMGLKEAEAGAVKDDLRLVDARVRSLQEELMTRVLGGASEVRLPGL